MLLGMEFSATASRSTLTILMRAVPRVHVASLQGCSFACLTNLRNLLIEAGNAQRTYAQVVTVDLAGLPAGLKNLEVRPQCWRSCPVVHRQIVVMLGC